MINNDEQLDEAIKRLTEIFDADPESEEGKEAQELVDGISKYEEKYIDIDALNIIRSYNLIQKMKKRQQLLFEQTGKTAADRFYDILVKQAKDKN